MQSSIGKVLSNLEKDMKYCITSHHKHKTHTLNGSIIDMEEITTIENTLKSEYDQALPQSHMQDQPTTPGGRATEH